MFLVDAEHDRLGESVARLQELGKVSSDRFGTRAKCNDFLEVLRRVLPVRDLAPEPVDISSAGAPAGCIVSRDDAVNAIRGQEAVLNSLPEAVLVDGVAEVQVRVSVIVTQRCCRHAELVCRLEVLQDFAPRAFVACAPTVALVYNNEIEEVLRVLLVEP